MSEQTRPLTADILKQFKRIERSGLLTAEINSVYFTLITNHSAAHQDTLDVMLIDNAGSIKEPYFDEFTSEEMMDLYDLVDSYWSRDRAYISGLHNFNYDTNSFADY